MKRLKSTGFALLCLLASARAQDQYAGYRTGNYTGVNGVFFNPANAADSRYRWDVNLFGINAGFGNNTASYTLKTIGKTFSGNADSLLFGNGNKALKGFGNVDVFGPSFMFNLNKKTSLAFTTRMRTLVNINDLDGQLMRSIRDQVNTGTYPYGIASSSNQTMGLTGWTDFGLTLGRVLSDKGKHFFKGGITLKYLAGIGNSYANINSLTGTLNKDVNGDTYLTGTTGSLSLGVGGINVDNISGSNAFKFNGSGVGADLGFVYEYRPDGEQSADCSANKYKYRIRVAALDLGSIRFKADPNYTAAYSVNIGAAQKFYLKNLDGKSISEIKTYLDGSPYFTNNGNSAASYNVSLPATIQGDFDLNLKKGWYVDLAGQLALHKKDNYKNPFYQNSVTLTPRYESKYFGVYVPLNYNALTQFNAGLSLRAGPLFIGSGSVLSALFGNSKQADVHVGVRFGGLCHKQKSKPVKVVEVIEEVKQEILPKDTDGDGITDDKDQCPTVAGTAKYHGCPVPDTDGDGIDDDHDKCPTEKGVAKYQGCPVPDTDGDGINDENDKCPAVKGVARYDGCPVPDTDGDGVNDEEDKCPNLAGTIANHGCPEVKQEVVKKINFAAKAIQFQTGKAVLLKSSYASLKKVAEVMKQDADLKLSIEGHTDNAGDDEKNQILSQKRAYAVLQYLKSLGIAESRLDVKGFGETMPVADNKTAAGRAKNRRVELKLNY